MIAGLAPVANDRRVMTYLKPSHHISIAKEWARGKLRGRASREWIKKARLTCRSPGGIHDRAGI